MNKIGYVRGSARPRKLWTWWRQRTTEWVWVCARIRTSQETMNLVTIEDNMKHHWIFCYTWQEILFQEFISEQGHNGWVWERQLTVVSIDIFWFWIKHHCRGQQAKKWNFFHLAKQKAAFGHSLRLVVRHGRGHEIEFGWKGWSCRGWVLLLLLLLRCEVSEQLCLDILYIWLWDMGEGIE